MQILLDTFTELTLGLTEKSSPSLSLASLNEVARYSAYLETVVWDLLEVQYHTCT